MLNALLEAVHALPVKDIISFDQQGTLQVQGKKLDTEQAIAMQSAIAALKNNMAYRLIKEQIAFEAVKYGVHSSLTFDMLYMSKAALWIQQQEINLISKLGTEEEIV